MKRFDVLSIFPQVVEQYLSASILGRAQAQQLFNVRTWDIRQYTTDKHRTVDDPPYGGGAGMVMKIEPIDKALQAVAVEVSRDQQEIIVLSARGRPFTQAHAQQLAQSEKSLTLLCGRYEGIDQRVADYLADDELAIGPYVLAGGELAALVVIEAIARLLPGVLGNPESLSEESHGPSTNYSLLTTNSLEYPQYTKPTDYRGWPVPPVLLSGNHEEIRHWRQDQSHPPKTKPRGIVK